jgi:hypothetical protein
MTGRPIYARITEGARRRAILALALHNYMDKGLMSYHHWGFSCAIAVSKIESLEALIANRDELLARKTPLNLRDVFERTP